MSMNKDEFTVSIIGNLVSKPKLVEDEEGNKVCYARIATNPRARKIDPQTNEPVSNEVRNRLRSIVELKVTRTAAAEKFDELLKVGDRVWINGEAGTRQVPKYFLFPEENKWYQVSVDIEGEKVDVMEDRLIVRVHKFGKIEQSKGNSTLVYA
jgi:single-stranded DNA-binding protein